METLENYEVKMMDDNEVEDTMRQSDKSKVELDALLKKSDDKFKSELDTIMKNGEDKVLAAKIVGGITILTFGSIFGFAIYQADKIDKRNEQFRNAMPIVRTIDSTYFAKRDSLDKTYHCKIDSLRKIYENTIETKTR